DELQRIVSKALRKDREERYQTIRDVTADLKVLRRHLDAEKDNASSSLETKKRGEVLRAEGAPTRTAALAETGDLQRRPSSSAEYLISEIKQHKVSATFAVSITLICLAGLVYAVLKWTRPQPDPDSHQMQITKVGTDGQIVDATISPDGNYVAYVAQKG